METPEFKKVMEDEKLELGDVVRFGANPKILMTVIEDGAYFVRVQWFTIMREFKSVKVPVQALERQVTV
jgi:hypothetical protein